MSQGQGQASPRSPWVSVGSGLIVVALLAALTVAIAAFMHSHASPTPAAPRTLTFPALSPEHRVATVDGVAIPMRELQIFLTKDRADILARYQSDPAAGTGDQFWSHPVDGDTPAHYLTEAALTDVAKTTVQLELAAKYQLIRDPSYGTFLAAFDAENKRRARATANHEVVYGPVKYTEANYLDYLIGQYAYDLEPKLVADGTIPVSEAALAAFFTENTAQYGSQDGTLVDPSQPATQAQIRRAFVDAEYQRLIQNLAAQTKTVASDTNVISSGGCLMTGDCTG